VRTAYRCRAYPDEAQQQALRHQHAAFQAFFARRARYPRFKSRRGRQSATYTRSAFRMRDGQLWLAKTAAPLSFTWTWPDRDVAGLDPTSVTVAKDPAGRWFVTFHLDLPDPAPLPVTGESVGVDVGLKDFAVLAAGLAATACGGGVRRTGATRARSPVKQEPQPARAGIPVF